MIKYVYMRKTKRRNYRRRLAARLAQKPDVLLEQLRREWDETQRSARRESIVRAATEGGMRVMRPLLALLAIGGVVTVGAVAPNVFAAVGQIGRRRLFVNEKDLRRCRYYFSRCGLAQFTGNGETTRVKITEKGRRQVLRSSFDRLTLRKERQWDGIWRIVVFDIPDKHKPEREGFRSQLLQLGMYCMQESVFVAPYPCEREIEFLIYAFSVGSYVRMIRTCELFGDDDLRAQFDIE